MLFSPFIKTLRTSDYICNTDSIAGENHPLEFYGQIIECFIAASNNYK